MSDSKIRLFCSLSSLFGKKKNKMKCYIIGKDMIEKVNETNEAKTYLVRDPVASILKAVSSVI